MKRAPLLTGLPGGLLTGLLATLLAAVALSLPAGPALAVDAVSGPTGATPERERIGPLRRDAQGRIVPDRATGDSDQRDPRAGTNLPRRIRQLRRGPDGSLEVIPDTGDDDRFGDTGREAPRDRRLDVRSYVDHDRIALDWQRRIDQIIREERRRKRQGAPVDARGLTPREIDLVDHLKEIERRVVDHESGHYYSGRPFTGQPRYWSVTGPDQRRYIVTGVTPMDNRRLDDIDAMLEKLLVLKRSALAPHKPSDVDRRVAERIDEMIQELKSDPAYERR